MKGLGISADSAMLAFEKFLERDCEARRAAKYEKYEKYWEEAKVVLCDNCGEEPDSLFHFNGEILCRDCIDYLISDWEE